MGVGKFSSQIHCVLLITAARGQDQVSWHDEDRDLAIPRMELNANYSTEDINLWADDAPLLVGEAYGLVALQAHEEAVWVIESVWAITIFVGAIVYIVKFT
jgi:hypothetical protein